MTDHLDAHARPPAAIRDTYKRFQRANAKTLLEDTDIIDSQCLPNDKRVCLEGASSLTQVVGELRSVFERFSRSDVGITSPGTSYAVKDIPGLYVYPALLPQEIQSHLLSVLLHRDLSIPTHQTNVHMHYNVPYPRSEKEDLTSYFDVSAASLGFSPKDPGVHKPITTEQFLNRKLRWMTLGGQYDWTRKVYPDELPPAFPPDTKALLESIFPMRAEAAIVNLYSPSDTLSLHRDVSEECDQPLVSISLGCDGIFVIGLGGDKEHATPRVAVLRLRSGDAVLMSGESRFAWHSVPKVVEDSCPDYLRDWPGPEYPAWEGWMSGKRINLNVRQMFD